MAYSRIRSFVFACLAALGAIAAFVCTAIVEVARSELPPLFTGKASIETDTVLRIANVEAVEGGTAGAMFFDRARQHDRWIGHGFTDGGYALPA